MSVKPPRKHLLFLNFPAFGHIIPLLELAKKTSRFHQVTFIVSACNHDQLLTRELIVPDQTDVRVIALKDGVSINFDTTGSTANSGLARVNAVVDEMSPTLTHLLLTMPTRHSSVLDADCPINDPVDVVITERFICSIALPNCHKRKVPCYVFNASSGSALNLGMDITDDTPAVPDSEAPPGSSSSSSRVLVESVKKFLLNVNGPIDLASGLIINNFVECDRRGLDGLKSHPKTKDIPVFCIGPIFPPESKIKLPNAAMTEKVNLWLDRQAKESVLYVSYGSLAALTKEQTARMNDLLTSTGRPYIFSVPLGLQSGFDEATRDGISRQFETDGTRCLILSWAPQKAILTHPSTGLFLTHAGWNSTLEGITGGVPMVAWPMFADQHLNGAWIAENRLGVLIAGTRLGSATMPEDSVVLEALAEAETCREKVKAMAVAAKSALAPGGSSERDFAELMKFPEL
ncbi:putative UDP-glycosyltransferase 73E1 [Hypsibius exemplaris]|uniref:UDP-glucuronosyltransferase n=1 Tax=Hypsibius exemplaris TaxID=2072580 RepID=A0A9X6RLP5_HYPEX|nr:putative UDP-glycosyltransferase 73E1 [Hypsibius exemplaris]